MSDDPRIEELLDLWEDFQERGEMVSLEDFIARFCPNTSQDLQDQLEAKFTALESMNQMLDRDLRPDESALGTESSSGKTSPEPIRLKPGAEPVPGYELVSPLGEGGFGEVWKALGPGGFHVALKFVRLDGRAAQQELRAIEITKTLRHPNLLSTFGTWQKENWLVIASELAGRSLYDRFRELVDGGEVGIPKRELHSYMNDAAKAIDFLNKPHHPLGDGKRGSIQHRDIKPQNLLLSGGGVKVADFGIARFLERHATGHTGAMSVAYAAPEFFNGQTSDRSDQYSLAVTYCELRGGRRPFVGSDIEVMRGHVEGEPDLSMLPERERPAVTRALAKQPEDRWANCREFVKAIRKSSSSADSSADPVATVFDPPPFSRGKAVDWSKWIPRIAIAALLIGILIWTAAHFIRGGTPIESTAGIGNENAVVAGNGQSDASRGESDSASSTEMTKMVSIERQPSTEPRELSTESPPADPAPAVAEKSSLVANTPTESEPKSKTLDGTRLEKIRDFIGHSDHVRSVAFSPDGKYVLSGGADRVVRLWDIETGNEVRYFPGNTVTVNFVGFSRDGANVISGGYDGTLRIWDRDTGKELMKIPTQGGVRECAIDRTGHRVICGTAYRKQGFVQVWDTENRKEAHRFKVAVTAFTVDISPDGDLVASSGNGGWIELRSLTAGSLRRLGDQSGPVASVRFSPDGDVLIERRIDGTIRKWGLKSGDLIHEMDGGEGHGRLAVSPDGKSCLSSGEETTLWDLRSGKLIDRIRDDTAASFGVNIGPEGKFALISVGNNVQLWKMPSRGE